MDPNQAHTEFRLALLEADLEQARESHSALRDWLARGGFAPEWTRTEREFFFSYRA